MNFVATHWQPNAGTSSIRNPSNGKASWNRRWRTGKGHTLPPLITTTVVRSVVSMLPASTAAREETVPSASPRSFSTPAGSVPANVNYYQSNLVGAKRKYFGFDVDVRKRFKAGHLAAFQ